ncbi:MAG TPA: EAL domain-containing protein, partial [Spirochaetales bacterium]|nr:EAL domain-containing protein [Spirochaetales bacterium]
EHSGLPASRLVVEITESVLVERLDNAAKVLGSIKKLGVGISVDDFGTGYSSFSYLKNLPVDTLKIDRGFVMGMENSATAREVVSGIIDLAHRMNLSVVAEGVESAEQYYILRDMGCNFVQGFLFGRPVPAQELEGRYFTRIGSSRFSAFLLRR